MREISRLALTASGLTGEGSQKIQASSRTESENILYESSGCEAVSLK